MTRVISTMPDDEWEELASSPAEDGFGVLQTARGSLPLKAMDVQARIEGLLSLISIRQTFFNTWNEPLEATYIFPLPDRAGVKSFRLEVSGRIIEGVLQERGKAREEYDRAIAEGHQAGIAEEERPGVFTLRVGNIPPGKAAVVQLELAGILPFVDGEVTFRFPLVVAPRYIPGSPLPGQGVGSGVELDTDDVPDASRISPPVLLPGFPNPVRLSLAVEIHESLASVGPITSSLHAVIEESSAGVRHVRIQPGERLDRDFLLRFALGGTSIESSASFHPDTADGGTFALTIVPPAGRTTATNPRDVFFLLDRSGSMDGWKVVAARRALARIVDTLRETDRFNVLAFDDQIERPDGFPDRGLVPANDRMRFRAVEFLARTDGRGGTEMAAPLEHAFAALATGEADRERILVLVTDGQVGNEDQLIRLLADLAGGIHVVTIGVDRAVNESFLRRLAELGGSRSWSECVETEDRLDSVLAAIQRRIGTPVLTDLKLVPDGFSIAADSLIPGRLPDLFEGVPLVLLGRYQSQAPRRFVLRGQETSGQGWVQTVELAVRENPAIASVWARGQIRKLEDRYLIERERRNAIAASIISLSEKFSVLSRFTAFVAVDKTEVVNPEGHVHKITQPVEIPAGWNLETMTLKSAPGSRAASRRMSIAPPPPPLAAKPEAFSEAPAVVGWDVLKHDASSEAPDDLPLCVPKPFSQDPLMEPEPMLPWCAPSSTSESDTRDQAVELLTVWNAQGNIVLASFLQNHPEWLLGLAHLIDTLRSSKSFKAEAEYLHNLVTELHAHWDQDRVESAPLLEIFFRIVEFLTAFSAGKPVTNPPETPPDSKKKRLFWWKS